jgi:hypothetical protein
MVDFLFKEDGSILAEAGGRVLTIEKENDACGNERELAGVKSL